MLYNNYIKCIQGKSMDSGRLQVFYSTEYHNIQQGPRTHIREPEDLFFNLVHPSGDQLKTITYGGQEKFAVNSALLPGMSIGGTDHPVDGKTSSHGDEGYYEGQDLLQVGLEVGYDNWSAILDISPELCDYNVENNLSRIIFSTMDSYDSLSGFYVGINQGNKLYIKYKKTDSSPATTLNSEVGKNSIININKGERSVSVGLYNLDTEQLSQATLNYEDHASSNRMYLGNFLSNTNTDYTGYQGYINDFALFDTNLSASETISSCGCMFSNGVNVTSSTSEIIVPNVTGFREEVQYITGVTGYVEAIKEVIDHGTATPTTMLVSYQSGVTGLVANGGTTTFLTGAPSVISNTVSTTGSLNNQDKLDLYNRYFLNFNNGLESGEHLEILSFSDPRKDTQLSLSDDDKVTSSEIRLYNYGLYRQSKNDISYMTQGAWGESGARIAHEEPDHDYDYSVNEDKTLSGFVTEETNIVYDLIDTSAICIDFSGYWGHAPIANLVANGLSPNKVFTGSYLSSDHFPSDAQFFNETDPSNSPRSRDQGQVIITGISGQKIWENNHIYYNGQKLIENIDFFTGHIETGYGVSVDALVITGGFPGVSVYGSYSYNGIINTPDSFYTPQMCFVPMVTGEKPEILQQYIGPCTVPPYCNDGSNIHQPQYTTEAACLETDGTCSDNSFTNKTTCLQNSYSWTPSNTWNPTYETKAICEAKGGAWAPFDGISDPLSGFSEMIWLNGVRLQKDLDYRKGRECSMSKSFTLFGENPFIFYNNNEEYLNYS
jgi:hypothetical protein